jgi:creatinine amidohydrolase/Fe(II)-dependent formamide hydrolase-like protein
MYEPFALCTSHDWFHAGRPVGPHVQIHHAAASVNEMLCVYKPPGDLDLPQTMGQQTEDVSFSGSTQMGRVGDPRTVEGMRGRMLALDLVDPGDEQLRVQAASFQPTRKST